MKNSAKRTIAALLALVMLVPAVPMTGIFAMAEGEAASVPFAKSTSPRGSAFCKGYASYAEGVYLPLRICLRRIRKGTIEP